MKTHLHLALLLALTATTCLSQTGTVTLYTQAISLKSEGAIYLPKSKQPYSGWILDGAQRLANLKPGRFVILNLSSGTHTFTSANANFPTKTPFTIDLKDGESTASISS